MTPRTQKRFEELTVGVEFTDCFDHPNQIQRWRVIEAPVFSHRFGNFEFLKIKGKNVVTQEEKVFHGWPNCLVEIPKQ